jgi:DNA-binding MarR family transcriptional regulator
VDDALVNDAPADDSLVDSVGFLLSQLGFSVSHEFRRALAPTGLEPRQFALLCHIARREGSPQNALGDGLSIPPSSMVGIVDALEERDLVERRPDASDRRVRTLFLTSAGRSMMEHARTMAMALEDRLCTGLDAPKRAQLLALLDTVRSNLGVTPGVHPGLGDTAGACGPPS